MSSGSGKNTSGKLNIIRKLHHIIRSVFIACRRQLHPRDKGAVHFGHPVRTKADHLLPEAVGGIRHGFGLDSLADRSDLAEIGNATFQQDQGPFVVIVAPMVQGHGHLKEPLIEGSDLSFTANPQILKGFVAIEPFGSIELAEGLEECPGG